MGQLIKKFGSFSIGPLIGATISFITVPMITFFVSPEEYGKSSMFTLAQGTISMLIYLGMDQAFVREFNAFKEDLHKLLSNAMFIPIISVVVLDVLIILNAEFVSFILFDSKCELVAVYLLAIMLFFMVIETFALTTIRMEEKGLQYSFFTIILKLLVLVLTIVLFLSYEKSFRSIVYAMALAEIINGSILYFIVVKPLSLSIVNLDRGLIKKLLKFGVPLIPAGLLSWILTSMDKIMLRTMCTYADLGLYTTAFKIVSVLSIVQTCFTLFWTPVAYRWYEEKVDNKNFENINKIVSFGIVSMCLILLLFKNAITLILGSDFENAIYVFPCLLLYPIMYTMSEATAVGIGFSRKTAYNIIVTGVSGGVNLVLNYLLIPPHGSYGAAIATGISYVVFFWTRTLISRKIWYKFRINLFVIYTFIVVINCIIHTLVAGYIPYLISIMSCVCVVLVNKSAIIDIINYIKNINKK